MTQLIDPCYLMFSKLPTMTVQLQCIYDMLNKSYKKVLCQTRDLRGDTFLIFSVVTIIGPLNIICTCDELYRLSVSNAHYVTSNINSVLNFIKLCEQPDDERWRLHRSLERTGSLYKHNLYAERSDFILIRDHVRIIIAIMFTNDRISKIIIESPRLRSTCKDTSKILPILAHHLNYY